MATYDCLKLSNQLCFPLYAASKEVTRLYEPYLREIDLTYTQYIAMLVLWEEDVINVSALGERLYLDSGTLTPLLQKMEKKGLIERERAKTDKRNCLIRLTRKGKSLKEKAKEIPAKMASCIELDPEDAQRLYQLSYRILANRKETK